MYCGVFSRIPSVYPEKMSVVFPTNSNNEKYIETIYTNVPEQNHALLRTTNLDDRSKFSKLKEKDPVELTVTE